MDLHETSEEKRRRAIKTKADPTLAITEDQPCKGRRNITSFAVKAADRLQQPWPVLQVQT